MGRGKERRAATRALVAALDQYFKLRVVVDSVELPIADALYHWHALHPDPPDAKDENLWTCPDCDAERPGYKWQLSSGSYADYDLQVLTCFCAECRTLLSVNVVGFLPASMRGELLKRQFPGGVKA